MPGDYVLTLTSMTCFALQFLISWRNHSHAYCCQTYLIQGEQHLRIEKALLWIKWILKRQLDSLVFLRSLFLILFLGMFPFLKPSLRLNYRLNSPSVSTCPLFLKEEIIKRFNLIPREQ